MSRTAIFTLCLSILLTAGYEAQTQGTLFIIGGGKRPDEMMKQFVKAAERFQTGKIVILPMASSAPEEVGAEQAAQLRDLGAKRVEFHVLTREQTEDPANTALLDGIGGVFFSGGVQSRLLHVLFGTPLHNKILEVYRKGAVIGGTSAGAAVMSEIMITGDEKREVPRGQEFATIEAGNILTLAGLGLIDKVIIDQHFVRRRRHNRLISLVVEIPELLGLGIDESTAVVVGPDHTFRVVGWGNVLVYDALGADRDLRDPRTISSHNMIMHILKPGDRFDLALRRTIR
jgi:cyanophycinase